MSSYDRTLLARLGCSDRDKQEARHDLACQYICQPETVEKLVRLLRLEHGPMPFRVAEQTREVMGLCAAAIGQQSVAYGVPVEKGTGMYKSTIGFVDVVLCFKLLRHEYDLRYRLRRRHDSPWDEWKEEQESSCPSTISIGVEVKIAPVPVGSLIRQINLYRSYTSHRLPRGEELEISRWVVATDYDIPPVDLASLTNERVVHVRLGQCFEDFVQACGAASPADQVEV